MCLVWSLFRKTVFIWIGHSQNYFLFLFLWIVIQNIVTNCVSQVLKKWHFSCPLVLWVVSPVAFSVCVCVCCGKSRCVPLKKKKTAKSLYTLKVKIVETGTWYRQWHASAEIMCKKLDSMRVSLWAVVYLILTHKSRLVCKDFFFLNTLFYFVRALTQEADSTHQIKYLASLSRASLYPCCQGVLFSKHQDPVRTSFQWAYLTKLSHPEVFCGTGQFVPSLLSKVAIFWYSLDICIFFFLPQSDERMHFFNLTCWVARWILQQYQNCSGPPCFCSLFFKAAYH